MARSDNLIPVNERSPEEQKEIRRKGAEAANRKKRERKAFREAVLEGLSCKLPGGVTDEETDAIVDAMIRKGGSPCIQDAIIAALFRIAVSGEPRSVEASKLILAQIGEDTPERSEITIRAESAEVDDYMG